MSERPKIFFSGGHITPAIAVADSLRQRLPRAEIIFVGRSTALEGSVLPSEEADIVSNHRFGFLPILAGRVTRTLTPRSIMGVLRIPVGFFQALQLSIHERPRVIISFGGYVALPLVIAGFILGIPSITHEQTRVPGLANRLIGLFAKLVCLSFPETERFFPHHKTVVTGLPLRESIFHPPQRPPFRYDSARPLLFITGGATGAVSLNRLIFPIITRLARKFVIIHQTGRFGFAEAMAVFMRLPKDTQNNYTILPYLDERQYAWILHRADLIVGRSGANTVGEIAALGKVALLVPLPWSAGQEQYQNAKFLVSFKTSRLVEQKDLTSEKLALSIEELFDNKKSYEERAKQLAKTISHDAARNVASRVVTLLRHG